MIWGALAFFVVAIVASLAFAALRGLALWRTLRGTMRRSNDALARVTEAAAAAERRAVSLNDGSARLTTAIDRLQRSLAQLAAIRTAAAEPAALLAALRGAVPRK